MAVVGTATVEIHATLDAVREEIQRGFDAAMAGLNTNIRIDVDTTAAQAKLDELRAKADGIGPASINVNADTAGADAKLVATKALADETTKKRTIKPEADTKDAESALVDLGFVLDKLGLQASAFGTGTQLKIGAIAGAIPAVGAALGAAFAALPALLGGIAAGAGAVMIGFSGVGDVIKGMSPDATAAQLKAMNEQLAEMSPQAAGVARELGSMVNGPLADLKKNIQSNLLGPLTGDFNALATSTLPIVNTGMSQIAGTVGVGLHDALQQVVSQGPQLSQMFGGMNTLLQGLTQQAIPSFIGSFISMGSAAAPAMKSVTDGLDSIFTGFQNVIAQQINMGTFTQAVSGLGPVLRGIGDVFNQLIGVVIQLGAGLSGGLGQALSDIAKLLPPLEPILESVGKVFLQLVDTIAQQLLPIFQQMTPAFETFVNALGQLLIPILEAVGPAVGQLVQGLLQVLTALEPLYGPTSLTAQAMQALGQIFADVAPLVTALGKVLGEIVDALSKALAPVIPIVVSAIKTLADALIPVADVVGKTAATLIDALAPTLPMIAQSFSDLVTALAPFLPQIAQLAGTLIQNLAPILPIIAKVFADVVNAIIPILPIMASLLPPLIILANVILPPLVSVLGFLADHAWIVVSALGAWAAIKVAETAAGWMSSVTQFTSQLSYLGNAAKDSEGAVSTMAKGWAALKDFPSTIGPAVNGIKEFAAQSKIAEAATKAWNVVQAIFDAELWANPITWVVLAIIALIAIIVLVVTHWKEVTKVVGEVWDKITGFATWLGGEFVSLWRTVSGAIVSAWNTVMSWFETALNAFVGFFKGIWTGISTFFTGIWDGISSFVVGVWNAIAGFFTGAFNAFVGFFKGIWDGIAAYFTLLWDVRFKQPVMAIWNSIHAFFVAAFAAFQAVFEAVWNAISSFFSMIWTGISTAAQFIWNVIKNFFVIEFNGFKAIFEFIWNAISTVFSVVWNAISSTATTVWNTIKGFFTTAFSDFSQAFSIVWQAISDFFGKIWDGISAAASRIWGTIKSFFSTAFSDFSQAFTKVWQDVSDFFGKIWDGISAAASRVWGTIKSFFTTAFSDFSQAFTKVWQDVSDFFGKIWDGISATAGRVWDGIKTTFTDAINAVIGFINGMIHGVNKVLTFLLIPTIGDIPKLAAGGTLTLNTVFTGNAASAGGNGMKALATGGALFEPVGPGFKTSGPKAIVGEGNPNFPEYVIPTDPTYRGNATALLKSAMQDMGMESGGSLQMLAGGGPLGWLGDAWNATGGKVVSGVANAIGNAFDSISGWIDTAVASTIHNVAHGVEGLMPDNLIGNMAKGAVEKMADGLISMITAGEQKKKANEQATAAAGAGGGNSATPAGRAANVAAVQAVANGYGWGSGAEWDALVKVLNRESGFNNVAQNPTSTAYGMFQFLNSTWGGYGIGKTSDPTQQAIAGLKYIASRYHDPIGAWNHEVSAGWYDQGGWLKPGTTIARNDTGHGEMILPEDRLTEIIEAAWGHQIGNLWDAWEHGLESTVKRTYGDRVEDAIEARLSAAMRDRDRPPVIIPPPPPPPAPPQPTTSVPVTVTTPQGDLGQAFKAALSQFAPELSQAISAGSATQIVQLGQALLSNPQRMAALNQSVADAMGTSVASMAGQVQDVVSSALPTARREGGTVDPTMGAAGTLRTAQSTVSSATTSTSSNDVTIHPGAFQVTVHGNADSVTVTQLQAALRDWNDELLHQVRGRR